MTKKIRVKQKKKRKKFKNRAKALLKRNYTTEVL